jgi:sodium/bile acid cotransporter 7
VLSGLGLKTEELKNTFKQVKFNAFVQIFIFFVDSSIVFGISRALYQLGALNIALADGIAITSCLPLTISMVTALTVSSNGGEAAADFNAAFGNILGIFLSPLIILVYLGASGSVGLGSVFLKLTLRVVLPICVGQILQKFCPPIVAFVKKHKPRFKTLDEWVLVYIVYSCTFCKTFYEGIDATLREVLTMVAVLLCIVPLLMVLAWFSLGVCFPGQPKLRVMGLFGCTQKSVGVPLIYAIYETSPLVGLYTPPVLIWYTIQLFIGTVVAPRLYDYVDREETRLGRTGAGKTLSQIKIRCGFPY